MNTLKFEDLPSAAERIIERLERMEKDINEIKESLKNDKPQTKESLMTRKETIEYLNVSSVTLWNWAKKGILLPYTIGGKVYYKRNEIDNQFYLNTKS